MRALVIDDARTIRAILGRCLRQYGFEVVEAADCLEALERLRSAAPPDLATVDWNMPMMTGLEFVRLVRANHAYDSMKIVMVTTETEPEQLARALSAGANEYMMKPFTPDVLRDKLLLLGVLPETSAAL